MPYREFNIWAYEYYLENLIPNTVNSLTIPSSEIENYLTSNNEDIGCWKELNENSWFYLTKLDNKGVPRFLGLIALQCHAAFKMHSDGSVSVANYRNRFKDLVGIVSEAKLNQLFGEKHNDSINLQEYIWLLTANFFSKKNILINIPTPKSYARRNTQYPQSQCVINYEDLKEYEKFFKHINSKYDIIHFEEFSKEYTIMLPSLRYRFIRNNNINTNSASENKIKLKQIFDHYVSDEWKNRSNNRNEKETDKFNQYHLKIYPEGVKLFDEDFEEITDIDKILSSSKINIFREDSIYMNEYNLVKKIELGSKYVFVVDSTESNSFLLKNLKENFLSQTIISFTKKIICYLCDLTTTIPTFLSEYIGVEYPLEIRGYKVSQKRQYFVSNPPKIIRKRDVSYSLYLDNKRFKEDQPTQSGKYIIKVNGYSNYTFEILDIPKNLSKIPESKCFLNLTSLTYTDKENGDMSGLFVDCRKNDEDARLTILTWINIQNKKKYKSSNIILKALNQSKNGRN